MMLTPKDISQKEFQKARVGGYKETDVDKFLDEIVADFEELYVENKKIAVDLKETSDKLKRYGVKEETLQSTIFAAQKVAEELQVSAKKEADEILANAKSEADKLVNEARTEKDSIIDSLTQLKDAEKEFRDNFLNLIDNFQSILKSAETEVGVEEEAEAQALAPEQMATTLGETVAISPEEVRMEEPARIPEPEEEAPAEVPKPEEAPLAEAPKLEEAEAPKAEVVPEEKEVVTEPAEGEGPAVSDEMIEEQIIKPEEEQIIPEKEEGEEEEGGPFGKSTEFEW